MSYGADYTAADEGMQVEVVVKWFNPAKGFGFVSQGAGGADAFLHVSVLNRAGLHEIADGTTMLCLVAPGPKGPQVTRIIEITGAAPVQPRAPYGGSGDDHGYHQAGGSHGGGQSGMGGGYHRSPAPIGPETDLVGTVKWYKFDKGFGFIMADDGGKDIFVHKSVLRRAGLDSLEPGAKVHMRVQTTDKGREATQIELV